MVKTSFFRISATLAFLFLLAVTLVAPVFADDANSNSAADTNVPIDQSADLQLNGQAEAPTYVRGQVHLILEDKDMTIDGQKTFSQRVQIKLLSGDNKNTTVNVDYGGQYIIKGQRRVYKGEHVVLAVTNDAGTLSYFILDHYRIPSLFWVFGFFVILALIFGRVRGLTSLIGLVVSIFILGKYIVPHIVSGGSPFAIGIVGTVALALISLYVAHGFNKRTSIAVLSTLITIGIAAFLSALFVSFTHLVGTGSEDALYAQTGALQNLDLRGLLLCGILIGTLGVLDDVTTGQTAAIEEIQKANGTLSMKELYRRGLSVGREHIASLVNTLALAYAGASLPLFLLFALNQSQPFWVITNNETVADEVIRTLVGSSALILAVPIATLLAAYFFRTKNGTSKHIN